MVQTGVKMSRNLYVEDLSCESDECYIFVLEFIYPTKGPYALILTRLGIGPATCEAAGGSIQSSEAWSPTYIIISRINVPRNVR